MFIRRTQTRCRATGEPHVTYRLVDSERIGQKVKQVTLPIETATGSAVHIQRVDDSEHQEVRLYCYSEQREQKERGINQRLCERFEAGLQKIADGLHKPRAEKRLDKLQQRIGRLQEKYHGIGQHYTIELTPDETGKKVIGLTWSKQPKAGSRLSHPGVYCLRSNEMQWDAEKLWRTYIMLTDLEAVFRSLKSELGLRPVYHHKEVRVDGHLFITVLAYQFVQIIRRQLKEHGIHDRWSTLRDILSVQQRVTAALPSWRCGIPSFHGHNRLLPARRRRYSAHPQKHTTGSGISTDLPHIGPWPASWRCTKNSTVDRISLKRRLCSALRSFINQ